MSYLEKLRDRRRTPVAVWHKLRTSIETGKFDFYIALEGEEDEEFYSRFLEKRFPKKTFRPLICDGKGGVIALHEEVVEAYGNPRNIFFFVDSDHDRFINQNSYPSQTFTTCGYSVENYIYNKKTILLGIKKYFNLNKSDSLFDSIEEALNKDSSVFEERSTTIMSYAVALRSKDFSPKLENINFHSIFKVEENELKK